VGVLLLHPCICCACTLASQRCSCFAASKLRPLLGLLHSHGSRASTPPGVTILLQALRVSVHTCIPVSIARPYTVRLHICFNWDCSHVQLERQRAMLMPVPCSVSCSASAICSICAGVQHASCIILSHIHSSLQRVLHYFALTLCRLVQYCLYCVV
jgi:hypothetical protein